MEEKIAEQYISPSCAYAIELLGKRWTGQILYVCMHRPLRFSEVTTQVEGLSDRILSKRLYELEIEGLVRRVVYPEKPIRVEYQLTEKGYALKSVFEAVHAWAEQWVELPLPCANEQEQEEENCKAVE